jgi:hypothetical protein
MMVDMSTLVLRNQKLNNKKGTSSWEVVGWLTTGSLLVSLALIYGWNQQQMIGLGYKIETVREENRKLSERQQALRAEYQTQTSVDRLDRKAGELGLVSANRPEVTIIEAGTPIRMARDLRASAETANLIDQP